MRIATWNINSVRLRLELVLRFLDSHQPDILCLQETKVIKDLSPFDAFRASGYAHIAVGGIKGYNGVAILSRLPFETLDTVSWCGRDDARHIAVRLPHGREVHNFYVPAGGDKPDVDTNPKFAHKLDFVGELTSWLPSVTQEATGQSNDLILLGDLNIAPLENDVWSHKQMLGVVSHTPVEVDALSRLRDAGKMVDAVRHFIPESQKLFSWWSYRARNWSASDRGRRLDHIWVTPNLSAQLSGTGILREARGWGPKPSDHVPVWIDIADNDDV